MTASCPVRYRTCAALGRYAYAGTRHRLRCYACAGTGHGLRCYAYAGTGHGELTRGWRAGSQARTWASSRS
eukprot:3666143-Rhodomonas_salina.1